MLSYGSWKSRNYTEPFKWQQIYVETVKSDDLYANSPPLSAPNANS